jgi:hypothetical protein
MRKVIGMPLQLDQEPVRRMTRMSSQNKAVQVGLEPTRQVKIGHELRSVYAQEDDCRPEQQNQCRQEAKRVVTSALVVLEFNRLGTL